MEKKPASLGPVRYAVVGLGYIAQSAVLPAFAHAKSNARLAALVSDAPRKLKALGKRYGVETLCNHEQYDDLLASGLVDAVYIALPNDMHKDYAVRAARHGVHVLCEKPLAMDERECRAMIAACRRADVRLMTAYRLHFEAANLAAIEAVRKHIGEPRIFTASFGMQVEAGNVRLDPVKGGGVLYDIGIYCINAARHLFQDEPLEVAARTVKGAEPRFRETEESVSVTMVFPGERLATFTTSFGTADASWFEVLGTKCSVCLDKAYEIAGAKTLEIRRGSKGRTQVYKQRDQFAAELLHFSGCVQAGREPVPDGIEGLRDVRIVRALYRSARAGGRPVQLDRAAKPPPFRRRQEITRPRVRKTALVGAAPPRGR